MKHLLILFFALWILTARPIANAEDPLQTHRFVTQRRGHTARLVLRTRAFQPARHRIFYANKEYELKHEVDRARGAPALVLRIDGREPLGTDQSLPRTEIESMTVTIDGDSLTIPKRLFADCFEPNLGKEYFAVRLSDNYQTVFVFMAGGDAAGSYNIIWVIPKNGEPTRFSGSCGDCGFLDFQSGFFK